MLTLSSASCTSLFTDIPHFVGEVFKSLGVNAHHLCACYPCSKTKLTAKLQWQLELTVSLEIKLQFTLREQLCGSSSLMTYLFGRVKYVPIKNRTGFRKVVVGRRDCRQVKCAVSWDLINHSESSKITPSLVHSKIYLFILSLFQKGRDRTASLMVVCKCKVGPSGWKNNLLTTWELMLFSHKGVFWSWAMAVIELWVSAEIRRELFVSVLKQVSFSFD